MMNFKKDVVYYYDEMIGTYHYAFAHPMKPLRVAMTDEIVRKYELDQHFDTIVCSPSFRTSNSHRSTSTTPHKSSSPPSTPMSTSTSSAMSTHKTAIISKISFIASISRRIVQLWSDCTIIVYPIPVDLSVFLA